jgi:hypothetical protein
MDGVDAGDDGDSAPDVAADAAPDVAAADSSSRVSSRQIGLTQEATSIMMRKALILFAKGIIVREDAKNFFSDRAKAFLEQLLCRHELDGSMDSKMVASAIAGWIPEQGDIGERMRSAPLHPQLSPA